jgi:outer membrane protein assembly factor BamD (BamD/ComL family)
MMRKRSPLILLALVLTVANGWAADPELKPNPTRFLAIQEVAKKLEDKGEFKDAARAHHRSQVYAPGDRDRAKALLGEADDYYKAGVHSYAKDAYLSLLRSYPLYAPQSHVLANLRELAELYASGAISTLHLKDVPMAIEIYETIIQETPTATGTINDHLRLAELQIQSGRDYEAIVTYEELLRRHGGRPEVANARLAFARLLIEQAKAGDGDGRLSRQARRQLAAYVESKPGAPEQQEATQLIAMIDEQQAQGLLDLAVFYTKASHRRLPAARRYLHDVVGKYPETAAAEQAKLILSETFGDNGDGQSPLTDEEVEARADLATSPILADKVTQMLNTVPPAPKALGTPKELPPLAGGDDAGKFLLPVADVNARN